MDISRVKELIQKLAMDPTIPPRLALQQLHLIEQEKLTEAARELLTDDNVDIRAWELSCSAIITIDHESWIQWLQPFLNDEDTRKRWHIVGLFVVRRKNWNTQ